MKKVKGFTLIELLVVIAIIGILASIVLISMRGMTDRAKDTRIKAAMGQVRSIAQLMYADREDGYTKLCSGGSLSGSGTDYQDELSSLANDITKQGSSIHCESATSNFCVAAKLIAKSGWSFCIDDDGNAVATSGDPATICSSASSTCQ